MRTDGKERIIETITNTASNAVNVAWSCGYNDGYAQGIEVGKAAEEEKRMELITQAREDSYKKGLDDGYAERVTEEEGAREEPSDVIYKKGYSNGAEHAWAAARAIFSEFTDDQVKECFPYEWDNGGFHRIMQLPVEQALEKYWTYMEKQDEELQFDHEKFYEFLLNHINPNVMEEYRSMFLGKEEKTNGGTTP